jgi:exodeoxyribonuclease VII large subunit
MRSLFDAPEKPAGRPERRVLTVSELNAWARSTLEAEIPLVWVEGEISNLRRYPSGHTYFTLKDATAQVSAVLFRGQSGSVRFRPEDGMKVLARGRVGLYEARGTFQIVVDGMEPAGLGALQMALEQLKARLLAEGLLDPARKRPLPLLPERIGIVTSLRAAALRDVLRVLERRFAGLKVVIAPVRVQGDGAPVEIAAGIRALNRLGGIDVLIVARGGGSLEDLWAFNEEVVARAIAASRIPVISAVGHETDVTLADLVADLRAPTPSAAAEMVVVSRRDMVDRVTALRARLLASTRLRLGEARRRLERLASARGLAAVERRVRDTMLEVDDLGARLRARLDARLRDESHRLSILAHRMTPARLAERVASRRARNADLAERLRTAALGGVRRDGERLGGLVGRLRALSPLEVLARGYAVCYAVPGGAILKAAAETHVGDRVRVRLHRGRLACEVKEVDDVSPDETL